MRFAILLLAVAPAISCGPNKTPNASPPVEQAGTAPGVTVSIVPMSQNRTIDAYSPDSVTVMPGTTVTWVNQDQISHTATSDNQVWDSGTLVPGQSFSFRFDNPGTYTYHCAIHPNMTGNVIVSGG